MKNRRWVLELLSTFENSFGMEIGVWEGDFSAKILRRVKPAKLFLVDPWEHDTRYPSRLYGIASQDEMDRRYDRVCERFSNQCSVVIKRQVSESVWQEVPTLDWVYIDGNHSRGYVCSDLLGADSKLRPGGLIIGDDCRLPPDESWPGVFKGLMDFLRSDVGNGYEVEALRDYQFVIRKPAIIVS